MAFAFFPHHTFLKWKNLLAFSENKITDFSIPPEFKTAETYSQTLANFSSGQWFLSFIPGTTAFATRLAYVRANQVLGEKIKAKLNTCLTNQLQSDDNKFLIRTYLAQYFPLKIKIVLFFLLMIVALALALIGYGGLTHLGILGIGAMKFVALQPFVFAFNFVTHYLPAFFSTKICVWVLSMAGSYFTLSAFQELIEPGSYRRFFTRNPFKLFAQFLLIPLRPIPTFLKNRIVFLVNVVMSRKIRQKTVSSQSEPSKNSEKAVTDKKTRRAEWYKKAREKHQSANGSREPQYIKPNLNTVVNGYTKIQQLAEGGQAVVFLAENSTNKNQVVLKHFITKEAEEVFGAEICDSEYQIVSSLSHPNIIQTFGIVDESVMVSEFMNQGDLSRWIYDANNPLNSDVVFCVLKSVASGLAYIHDQGYIHRDIKPQNILLHHKEGNPKQLSVKITDFGWSITQKEASSSDISFGGSPGYAPLHSEKPSSASDIYSFAITCYHMLFRMEPGKIHKSSILRITRWKKYLTKDYEIGNGMLNNVFTLLRKCRDETLDKDSHATNRPSAKEICNALEDTKYKNELDRNLQTFQTVFRIE